MNKLKFVYFDVGGVVISDLTSDSAENSGWKLMKKDLGIKPESEESFDEFFNDFEHQVCVGRELDEIIPELKNRFGLKLPQDYSMLQDFVNRFGKNPSIWSVVAEVSKSCGIGLLTNMYPGMLEKIMKKGLIPDYKWEVIINSSVEKSQKPEKRIFEIAQQKSGFSGNEILFVDNPQKHTSAAKDFGWQTFLYNPKEASESSQGLLKYYKTLV